jgi:hypothetical protein
MTLSPMARLGFAFPCVNWAGQAIADFTVTLGAASSRGPRGPTGPPRTPSRTPWFLSR